MRYINDGSVTTSEVTDYYILTINTFDSLLVFCKENITQFPALRACKQGHLPCLQQCALAEWQTRGGANSNKRTNQEQCSKFEPMDGACLDMETAPCKQSYP